MSDRDSVEKEPEGRNVGDPLGEVSLQSSRATSSVVTSSARLASDLK